MSERELLKNSFRRDRFHDPCATTPRNVNDRSTAFAKAHEFARMHEFPYRIDDGPRRSFSVVIPCYNEAANLPLLHERLCTVLGNEALDWEMIIVDDHSVDDTFGVATDLARRDERVRAVRLSRNVGSHLAAMCGLDNSGGAAVAIMSADLQDPPETLPLMLERWRRGEDVVWAVREASESHSVSDSLFSRLYFGMVAKILRAEHVAKGADFVLVDRVVVDALAQYKERNLSVYATIAWLGFRQGVILYRKKPRAQGSSGWTLRKKLKLVVDSVTSFSYLPIRAMTVVGMMIAVLGFIYSIVIIANYFAGQPPEGWTSLVVLVLILGGFQMVMLGTLGEYLWRCLDEARNRPRYHIERRVPRGWHAQDSRSEPS
jgi:glycosyltransferase involved in cell wall biosynthesis